MEDRAAFFKLAKRYLPPSNRDTLRSLGLQRSEQALRAGHWQLTDARRTSYRSTSGTWLAAEKIQAAAALVRAEMQAEVNRATRAERLARLAPARREAVVRRAARRLRVEEHQFAHFAHIVRNVPLTTLRSATSTVAETLFRQALAERDAAKTRKDVVDGLARISGVRSDTVANFLRKQRVPLAMHFPWSDADPKAQALADTLSVWDRHRRMAALSEQALASCKALDGSISHAEWLQFLVRPDVQPLIKSGELDFVLDAAQRFKAEIVQERRVRRTLESEFLKRFGLHNLPRDLRRQLETLAEDRLIGEGAAETAHRISEALRSRQQAETLRNLELVCSKEEFEVIRALRAENNPELLEALALSELAPTRKLVQKHLAGRYGGVGTIMASPPNWYPAARARARQLTAILGPTNSGKTHEAMRRLADAPRGVYLAPLRLLAHEVGDRLRTELELRCAIVTGEERDVPEGATHFSSTIEMLDPAAEWDVAVIDEAQMLADPDRGWAWTQALLAVNAREVIILGSASAEPPLRELAKQTGEPLEVIERSRLGPLRCLPEPVSLHSLEPGTVIVAFSRRAVLSLAEEIKKHHAEVSVIYGALSPDVRRSEAARFRNGEAQVCVATDAIGMGLNLPCKTILFWETSKFDGKERRVLNASEILQIAGRAGRYGQHPEGFVGVVKEGPCGSRDIDRFRSALASQLPPLRPRLPLTLTPELARAISAASGEYRVASFPNLAFPRPAAPWVWQVSAEYWSVAGHWPKSACLDTVVEQAQFASAPARIEDDAQFLTAAARSIVGHGGPLKFQSTSRKDDLEKLEQRWRRATLYLWLARRWPNALPSAKEAEEQRTFCDEEIRALLRSNRLALRCTSCGGKMPPGHPFPRCESCYSRERSRQRSDNWDEFEEDE